MSGPPKINIWGIRAKIPSGYVVGRLDPKTGAAQLIPLKNLGHALGQSGSVATPGMAAALPLEFLGFQAVGLFAADQNFPMTISPVSVTFPSAHTGHDVATCTTAPLANTHFILTNDLASYLSLGTHVICTVSFAAGSKVGTFAYTATTVPKNTVLYVVMAHSADLTFAGVQCLFCGDPHP
jgi:hypothetical protein